MSPGVAQQPLPVQPDTPVTREPQPAAAPSPQPAGEGAPRAPQLTTAKLLSKLSKAEARKGLPPAPDSAMNFRPAVQPQPLIPLRLLPAAFGLLPRKPGHVSCFE